VGQAGTIDINTSALWWVGPLTIVAAVLLVFATRAVAVPLFGLDGEFPPLTYGGLAFFTVVLVGLAVLVFAGFVMRSSRPVAGYRRVALAALALSMLPDAWLPGRVPGATWPIAIVLMATHVAAWLPTVFVLTNSTFIGRRRQA
jgi:uncharacterized integral membrane protein